GGGHTFMSVNAINRLLVGLLALGLLGASLVAGAATLNLAWRPVIMNGVPWIHRAIDLLPAHGSARWEAAGVSVAAALVCLLVLLLELRPDRSAERVLL